MNNDIVILREAIKKIIPMLAGKGLIVTQIGTQAYVLPHPTTGLPWRVNIPLLPDNAEPEFVVAIQGFIDHEVAHVLYTDFLFKAHEKSKRLHNLHNIVEDTMIERKMGNDFPGSKRNISKLREYFLRNVTKVAIDKADSKQAEFNYLLVVLMRALAGHAEFQQFMDDNNYWDHELVKPFMQRLSPATKAKIPLLDSTEETYEVALEIEAILYPPPPPAPPPPPEPEEQDDQDQSDSSDDQDESEGEDDQDHSDEEQTGDGEGKGEREHTEDNDTASGGEGDEDESDEEKEKDAGEGENGDGDGEEKADEQDGDPASDESDGLGDADQDGEDDADKNDDAGEGEDQEAGADDDANDESGSDDSAGSDDDGDEEESDGASDEQGSSPDASDDETDPEGASSDSGDQEDADQSEGENDQGDTGDDDEQSGEGGSDAAESSGAEEGEDGEEGGKPDLSNVAIEDVGEGENESASDSDDDGTEAAGIGYDPNQNPFAEMDDDALDEKDLSSALVKIIVKQAIQACNAADYSIFTREYDVIEPVKVPEDFKSKWTVELEDETRALTGVMQKDIERMMAAQSRVFNVAGQRSGRLNSSGLHRLTAGDARVFKRREEIRAKDTAVALLSDCSGSMSGAPMATALSAAYALASVLERCNIPSECMGFTTAQMWGSDNIISKARIDQFTADLDREVKKSGVKFSRIYPIYMPIFKEFHERINADVKKRFAYQRKHQPHMGGNIDGESLEYAAIRLAKRKEKRKVIIVLSDGFPAGADGDDEHLKYMVERLNKQGFDLVGIGIKSPAVSRFYDNYLILNSVAELPKAVMGELKKILMK